MNPANQGQRPAQSQPAGERQPFPQRQEQASAKGQPLPQRQEQASAKGQPLPQRQEQAAAKGQPLPQRQEQASAKGQPLPHRQEQPAQDILPGDSPPAGSWMEHPGLKGIDPAKLMSIMQLYNQAGSKSSSELLPFLLASVGNMQRSGMSLSQDEFRLIFDALKQGKSQEELARMNQMIQMFRMMNPGKKTD